MSAWAKKQAKKADFAASKELDGLGGLPGSIAVDCTRGAANGQGEEEIFAKKLSKEEKKAAADEKKEARRAEKAARDAEKGKGEKGGAATKKGGDGKGAAASAPKPASKMTAAERAEAQTLELEAELEAARVTAARARSRDGAYRGALDMDAFTLPNPGGGAPLLEDATCTLVRGRRYGLIGRNGKGKSTLLRALAARRVGAIPPNVTIHYVSQEVILSAEAAAARPVEHVVKADVERRLLLEEAAELDRALGLDTAAGGAEAAEGAEAEDPAAAADESSGGGGGGLSAAELERAQRRQAEVRAHRGSSSFGGAFCSPCRDDGR